MAARLADNSVDLTVTSIPFGALFMYSGKPEDIGNNQDGVDMRAGQFGLHMRFFIAQLARVTKPGRNVCIHIQQLLRYLNQHGYMGRRDFRGAVIDMFAAGGLEWIGEVVIPKNPQVIAQRLSLHSLMFVTGKRDSTKLSPAVTDYVLIFQKPGESEPPVAAIQCPERNPDGWLTAEEWIRDAHGVWANDNTLLRRADSTVEVPGLAGKFAENLELEGFERAWKTLMADEFRWLASGIMVDIRETDTLDGWRSARETNEEKHVCPLQLEVIRRFVRLYTNPGELVMDPFMGIGSSAYVCVEQGRRAIGFELKETYHALALRNLEKQERQMAEKARDLFTMAAEKAQPMQDVPEADIETTVDLDADLSALPVQKPSKKKGRK